MNTAATDSSRVVLVAIGNPLRGDDAVAHRVLDLIGPLSGVEAVRVHQLTPELAAEIATASSVVFIDADTHLGEPTIEPLFARPDHEPLPLSHAMHPADLIALSRALCGFRGTGYLCRVPGLDFELGSSLSPFAEHRARHAVSRLSRLLGG